MAKDKRPKDDLQTARSRMAHAPAEDKSSPRNERDLSGRDAKPREPGRQDMGRRDLDAGTSMDLPDEPATPPDEPARMKQSMTRADKQRNQPPKR
ncbi:hypothetical protein WEI85_08675 [Actinomycetes bacterium KLBMP 9797]